MKNWRSVIINPDTILKDAIHTVDAGCVQIALVADESNRLLGTLADGDIRRAILSGVSLNTRCVDIMNSSPTTALIGTTNEKLLTIMRRGAFHQVPLVDNNGILHGLITIDEIVGSVHSDNWVVLMAGGLGSRLYPLTAECPKPLLKVGGKPILENIIMAFAGQGFRKFYISVNYKSEMIIDYFGDGSNWGVDISYIHEKERLGTAGSLSLLPSQPEKSFIVMNGDLLTHADFSEIIQYHETNNAAATVVAREYESTIPFGVINVDGNIIKSIDEKPTSRHLVSTGIYALSPTSLEYIRENEFLDMPDLLARLINDGKSASAYKFSDYWLDIGRIEEFERAQREWSAS
jgi:dTDP-glucose pyrophosphorylase